MRFRIGDSWYDLPSACVVNVFKIAFDFFNNSTDANSVKSIT
ncbi:hypothetical protein AP058_00417 [Flavobacterium sp. TAB 87]|nr:hypothetical protein AP058_00417 [Flavobacterium sp. TAB 87]